MRTFPPVSFVGACGADPVYPAGGNAMYAARGRTAGRSRFMCVWLVICAPATGLAYRVHFSRSITLRSLRAQSGQIPSDLHWSNAHAACPGS